MGAGLSVVLPHGLSVSFGHQWSKLLLYYCHWVTSALCTTVSAWSLKVNLQHVAVALGAGNCDRSLCQQLLDVFGLLRVCSSAMCMSASALSWRILGVQVGLLSLHSPGADCWLETGFSKSWDERASHHWWVSHPASLWRWVQGLTSWWITLLGNWSMLIRMLLVGTCWKTVAKWKQGDF